MSSTDAPLTTRLDVESLLSAGLVRIALRSEDDLLAVGTGLGSVLRHDIVVARESRGPRDNTLSGKHGLRGLPPHTDGATWPVPPRWIILRSSHSSESRTLFYDTASVVAREEDAALRRIWVVVPGGRRPPFYSPVLRTARQGWWVRFNTDCMRPVVSDGEALLRLISGVSIEHRWLPNEAVVFDNWRFLQAREPVPPGVVRRLERLTIR